MLVSAAWSEIYFKTGVLVITRCIPVELHHTNMPSRVLFEKRFQSNGFSFTSSLKFRELGPNTYGFREGLMAKSLSLVHGVVIFDDENNQVIVKGFFNWTLLCFWLIWLIIPPLVWILRFMSLSDWSVALIYLAITFGNLGISYLIDHARLSALAEFAAQSWARKYIPAGRG